MKVRLLITIALLGVLGGCGSSTHFASTTPAAGIERGDVLPQYMQHPYSFPPEGN
jgi:hypothetical protein